MTSERLLDLFHNEYYSFKPHPKILYLPKTSFLATPLRLNQHHVRAEYIHQNNSALMKRKKITTGFTTLSNTGHGSIK